MNPKADISICFGVFIIFQIMDTDFKHKWRYNPQSNRLQNYDYSSNGAYFITICTKERQHYFWEVVDGEMILNNYWEIIYKDIQDLEGYYKYVIIDEFIVMPDHVHFVIFIGWWDEKDVSEKHLYTDTETNNDNEILKFSQKYYKDISPKKWELWNIIKLLKWYATKKMNRSNNKVFFAWQKNYYERVVRNKEELYKIRRYIINNPLKWETDKGNDVWIFM